MSKTSTTLALTISTIALVLLNTVPGSTLAHSSLSNSGNIIKSDQNCSDTDSCTLTSSNVINQQPASTTSSPSPSPSNPCFPTALTILSLFAAQNTLSGYLQCAASPDTGVPGAIITFTGTGVPPNVVATTDSNGHYFVRPTSPTTPGTYTAQAHFAGGNGLDPSESTLEQFVVP